ncbi:MAG: AraC family transcriptional regulator [Bacteroides sp.]|nr:AraC family transcriptional regulator [Bacteroides sp.]
MNQEQQTYISSLNTSVSGEIRIKHTGREGISLPTHQHGKHQIVYTLSGTLHVQTTNISYFVPEHHLAWIPVGMEHELSSNNRQISLVIFYCDATPDAETDSLKTFSIYNIDAFMIENLKFIASSGEVISRREQPNLYDFAFSFFRLIPTISHKYEIPLQSLIVPGDSRLRPVLRYITEHIGSELTFEQVATEFGFSVRNLSRLFRNENIRFNTYLNYQRITRAIELFAARDKTLQEIAYEVGFNSPNNFTRVFKQLLGVSPNVF